MGFDPATTTTGAPPVPRLNDCANSAGISCVTYLHTKPFTILKITNRTFHAPNKLVIGWDASYERRRPTGKDNPLTRRSLFIVF